MCNAHLPGALTQIKEPLATSLMIAATNPTAAGETASDECAFSETPLFLWGISIDDDTTVANTTGKISQDTPPASNKDSINFKDTMFELGAAYALFETPKVRWEVMGGVDDSLVVRHRKIQVALFFPS